MKKFVLGLDLQDNRDKRRALKTACTLSGINEISIDMNGKILTMVGTVDPVSVVSKLRKNWPTAHIISVGPVKEEGPKIVEPKEEEPKKEEVTRTEEPKKVEEAKNEEESSKKEDETKKKEVKLIEQPQHVYGTAMPYRPYYPLPNTYYYYNADQHSMEENVNACVIC